MTSDAAGPPRSEAAPSAREAASAYIDNVVIGYLLYGVGAVTAFLAAALALSDAQAALHSSLLAVGLLAAGLSGDRIDSYIGSRRANVLGYGLLVAGSIAIVIAVMIGYQ